MFVVYATPFFTQNTMGLVEAFAHLPGIRLGVISQEPQEVLPVELRSRFAGHWRVHDALNLDQLTWARYHDVVMPAYHAGNCVVVGDAAHATSPQLGQGTNLALLDALALASALREERDVPSALARYTRDRKGHLRYYGQASRWLTPLFQSDLRLLPWLRDVFMGYASAWPIAGPLTCQTLVGVRQGWLPGRTLDLVRD